MTRTGPREARIGSADLRVDDDQPTFWERVASGRWEPETIATVERLVGPDTAFLDLGAWVGPLSLLAAAQGARAIAVEADPAALDQLRRNLLANPSLAARVTVLPRAVAGRPGKVRLGARRKPGDSMSSELLAGAVDAWEVETVTPDDLDALLGPTRDLLVKLDIEGGEYALLPALAPLLRRRDATLLLSLHPAILAETGERDPAARTRAALAAYTGWRFAVLAPGDPVDVKPDDATLLHRDTWLIRPPHPSSRA